MKKSVVLGLIVIAILALAGIGYYIYLAANGPEEASEVKEKQPRSKQPSAVNNSAEQPAVATTAGSYTDFSSEDKVTKTDGTKILFFHAPWCPQCRQLDSELSSAELPNNVTIFKTDYDSHQDLRAKYGVTLQTTFVAVDSNGDLIKKYVAYDEPTYDTLNREFISKL